jgi:hypothetical protein
MKSSPVKSFCYNPRFYAAPQKEFTDFCGPASNQRRVKEFKIVRSDPDADLGPTSSGESSDKSL